MNSAMKQKITSRSNDYFHTPSPSRYLTTPSEQCHCSPRQADVFPSQLFHRMATIIRGVKTAFSCQPINYADESPEFKYVNEVPNRLVSAGQRFSVLKFSGCYICPILTKTVACR